MTEMTLITTYRNGRDEVRAAVIEFDGVPLLAQRGTGEIALCTWGPAQGMATENPGWAKLKELEAAGLAEYVYEGLSIAHGDRYVWRGGPLLGLDS